ncbi:MAG: hypothetical protein JHC95_20985, partial [Solirubrobacteraceae bacterium]|nr:hypothetical protein [Solirubrobacteraceae bacterium]
MHCLPISTRVLLVASVAALASPGQADAGTIHVELGGSDGAACGDVSAPCASPRYAIQTRAAAGDTVAIGSGEFTLTSSIAVTKSLTISGATADAPPTVLDGANTTTLGAQGGLRYAAAAAGTTQTVEQLTFIRTGRQGSGAASAIYLNPGTGAGIDLTARDLEFTGGTASTENPFYADNNAGRTVFQRLTTVQTRGNSIQFGRHRGPVTVEDSYLETQQSRADFAIFAYTWGGAPYAVTGAQTFRRNTIRNGSGIGVSAGFSGLAPASFTAPVQISGNTLHSAYGSGITVRTIDLAGNPAVGTFTAGVRVADNVLRGGDTTTPRAGIAVTGTVPGATVTGNDVGLFTQGLLLGANPQGRVPADTLVRANQLVDNPASGAKTGLALGTGVTGVRAADNWWGCNAGPPSGPAATVGDCDGIMTPAAGAVSAPTWIVLALTSDAAALSQDGTATLAASLARNNAGITVTGAFRDGMPLPFTAGGGTLAYDSPPLMSGVASTVFRSGGASGRAATARFSHQPETVMWPDLLATPGPAPAPT